MICSKCNSEMPDGARFCTVCGAACGTVADIKPAQAPTAPEMKYFCGKCGLELQAGAKFCTVCGSPAANVGNIVPLTNEQPMAFGQGEMGAVSLEKEPTANDLVAAMNSAAPAAAPVQAPKPEQPMSAPSYNSGFSAPAPVPQPSAAPTFAPPAGTGSAAPMGDVLPGAAGAAAAVAVRPAKKKMKTGAKVGLIIGITVGVLAIAAGIFFLTNRATAMSLIMGKSKYAASVEKNEVKKLTDNINTTNLSNRIKTLTSSISTFGSLGQSNVGQTLSSTLSSLGVSNPLDSIGGLGDLNGLGGFGGFGFPRNDGNDFARMMASNPGAAAVDVNSFVRGYGSSFKDTWGVSGASYKIKSDIYLDSSVLPDDVSQAASQLGILNGHFEMYSDYAESDEIMGVLLGAIINGTDLNFKMVTDKDDNRAYISFPFVSDTALSVTLPDMEEYGDLSGSAERLAPTLDLDASELDRIINDVVDLYVKYYKDSEVSMEKGSLNVAGTVVEGKQITAEFGTVQLQNFMKDAVLLVLNDSYFSEKLGDFLDEVSSTLGADYFSMDELKNMVVDAIDGMPLDDPSVSGTKFVITTIINNSGKVLAKAYRIDMEGMAGPQIAYYEKDSESVYDLSVAGLSMATLKNVKTSETDGTITLTAGLTNALGSLGNLGDLDGLMALGSMGYGRMSLGGSSFGSLGGSITLTIDYSGVSKADFGTSQLPVGTYNIKFSSDMIPGVSSIEMVSGTTVSGDTAETTFSFNAPGIANISIEAETTLNDNNLSQFYIPSDSIDMDKLMEGEYDEATMEKLGNFIMELTSSSAIEDLLGSLDLDGLLGGGSISPADPVDPGILTPPQPSDPDTSLYEQLSDLENEVWDASYEVYSWFDNYQIYSGPAYEQAYEYKNTLSDLDDKLWDIMMSDDSVITKDMIENYRSEFQKILAQRESVIRALENEAVEAGTMPEYPEAGGSNSKPQSE